MAEPPLRLFFALWPDAHARAALTGIGHDLKRRHGGRQVRPEMLHLTLAFIGQVPATRVGALCEIGAAMSLPEQRVVLDRLGGLPGRGLVWLAPSEPPRALMAHAEALAHALREGGFELEQRAFRPHVTLLRRSRCAPSGDDATCGPVVLHARRRALVVSESAPTGARYRELMHWEA